MEILPSVIISTSYLFMVYISSHSPENLLDHEKNRGPVVLQTLTQHLVLVYILMLLYMYIAPRQGQTTPWGQMLMSTESPYHFAHLLQVLKQSLKHDFKVDLTIELL